MLGFLKEFAKVKKLIGILCNVENVKRNILKLQFRCNIKVFNTDNYHFIMPLKKEYYKLDKLVFLKKTRMALSIITIE